MCTVVVMCLFMTPRAEVKNMHDHYRQLLAWHVHYNVGLLVAILVRV